MLADSWTFTSGAASYTIDSPTVSLDFSVAGPTGGLINNANANQIITINGNINGAVLGVGVQQLGNSTLVLAGTNGYTGGTLISSGIVQVTNANSLGDVSSIVTLNGGTLQVAPPALPFSLGISNNFVINAPGGTVDANGAQLSLSGLIADGTGVGVLRLVDSSGGGSVQLSNLTNTYSGGTLVSGTTVIVSGNGSVGTGTVTLDNATFQADGASNLTIANRFVLNNSNFLDPNGTTLTIAGNITGTGSVEVQNNFLALTPGTVVMLGANTYTGGTTICSCSTLQLGDATHTASIIGDVNNLGLLNIVNANTSGITSIYNGGGTTTFFNSASASQIQITNDGGRTTFRDSATGGAAQISNLNGADDFPRLQHRKQRDHHRPLVRRKHAVLRQKLGWQRGHHQQKQHRDRFRFSRRPRFLRQFDSFQRDDRQHERRLRGLRHSFFHRRVQPER